jgi:hypothetical protein
MQFVFAPFGRRPSPVLRRACGLNSWKPGKWRSYHAPPFLSAALNIRRSGFSGDKKFVAYFDANAFMSAAVWTVRDPESSILFF